MGTVTEDYIAKYQICRGCEQMDSADRCLVYKKIPGMYYRSGVCPFNLPATLSTKQKVRAGQQKSKRIGG